MPKTKTAHLNDTARHEAGHAVMRWLLDKPAAEISIDFDQPGNGSCGDGIKILMTPWDMAMLSLAGPVAEDRGRHLYAIAGVSGSDFDSARAEVEQHPDCFEDGADCAVRYRAAVEQHPEFCLAHLPDGEVNGVLYCLSVEAHDMMTPYDGLIEDIAAQVMEHAGFLSAQQVTRLCQPYDEPRRAWLQHRTENLFAYCGENQSLSRDLRGSDDFSNFSSVVRVTRSAG